MNTNPIGQNAFDQFKALGFTSLQIHKLVTLRKQGYAMSKMALPRLMELMAKAKKGTDSILSGDRIYKFPRIGNIYPFAISAGNAVRSNANMTITIPLSDPTSQDIGTGSIISDNKTNVFAEVTSISAGVIVAKYINDSLGSGSFTANDFAVGNQIVYNGFNGGNYQYKAAQSSLALPELVPFQIGTFNADCFIYAEDAAQQTEFNVRGQNYYLASKEMQEIDKMMAAMTNHFFSMNSGRGGDKPLPASFLSQMKTGGSIMEAKNGFWALEDFEDKLNTWSISSAIDGQVYVICDTLYATNISRVLRPFTETAGVNNIFGAKSGLNVRRFECGAFIVNVIVDPYFNNYQMNGGNKKDSALWICDTDAKTVEGQSISPIVDVYYGEQGLHRSEVEGKKNAQGKSVAKASNDQPYTQVTYDIQIGKVLANPDNFMWHQGQVN